jgi:hypothetical protein
MKVRSGRLFVPALVGLSAVVLGWRPDEAPEVTPTPAAAAPSEGWSSTVPARIFAKRLIARDVVAGGRSLLEAAALFRELNRLPPKLPDMPLGYPIVWTQPGPARSAEEQLCWQVISWVRSTQTEEMPGREDVAVRLEAEVQVMLWDPGAIRLPDAQSLTPVRELLDRARGAMTRSQWEAYRGRHAGGGEGR